MVKILVIGDDLRSFLAIVRSLHRRGIEVHAAPFDFSSPALTSACIAKVHRLPPYALSAENWLMRLQALIAQHHYTLIIPCDDRSVLPLYHHRGAIDAPVAVPNDEAMAIFFDKVKTRELANSLGVPVAKGGEVSETLAQQIGLPLALKPRSSMQLSTIGQRHSVRIIRSAKDLSALNTLEQADAYFLEAYFAGVGVGVSVIANHGEVCAAFQHERLQEATETGGSSSRKSVALDPRLLNAVRAMCIATRLHGVAMFEFRQNNARGDFILLEVNARFWGSLPLAIAAGIDFPALLFDLMTGVPVPQAKEYNINVYHYHLTGEYYRILLEGERMRSFFARVLIVATRLPLLALKALLRPYAFDSFTADDRKPWLAECRVVAGNFMRTITNKLPENVDALRSKSALQLKLLLDTAGPKPHMIFICLGNICRSPFAERLLRAKLGDLADISSAGTIMIPNRVSPPDALASATAHYDINLSDHRSTYVDVETLEDESIIFIFDDRNEHELAQLGVGTQRTIRLGNLIGQRDIADPYARGRTAFDICYQQISEAVDIIVTAVKSR